jgi:hypothetical protein
MTEKNKIIQGRVELDGLYDPTPAQKLELQAVHQHFTKAEHSKWYREYNKIKPLVDKANSISMQILKLQLEQQELIDTVDIQRETMVANCVHPTHMLVHHTTYIECKFCAKKISLPRINDDSKKT